MPIAFLSRPQSSLFGFVAGVDAGALAAERAPRTWLEKTGRELWRHARMGEKYHPVLWSELDYDPDRGGHTVLFTAEQLKGAPSDSIDALTKGDGRTFRDRAFTRTALNLTGIDRPARPPSRGRAIPPDPGGGTARAVPGRLA